MASHMPRQHEIIFTIAENPTNPGKLFDFAPLVCTYCMFGLFTFREDITVAEMIVRNDFQFCRQIPREGGYHCRAGFSKPLLYSAVGAGRKGWSKMTL